MESTNINVSEEIGKWLISRNSAIELLNKTRALQGRQSNDYCVKINFTGVNFISRSFADQLLKELYVYDGKFILINPKRNISKLLGATSANYQKERILSSKIYPHYTVRNKSEFFEKLGID